MGLLRTVVRVPFWQQQWVEVLATFRKSAIIVNRSCSGFCEEERRSEMTQAIDSRIRISSRFGRI